MARTRSKPAKSTPKESTPEPSTCTAKPLPQSSSNPPKLFVLPKDTSKDVRIVTLDNPANATPSRYLFCPQKGFYEFTRIAAPKKDCKSWLITGDKSDDADAKEADSSRLGTGYIAKSADLFVATPIDILFLVLCALAPKSAKETKQHFLALDDHIDALANSSRDWRTLVSQFPSLRGMIEKRMRAVCDVVEAGDETMFRLSSPKLLDALVKKAERMVKKGLPPSLEEKFITSALDVPIMSVRREDSTLSAVSVLNPEAVAKESSAGTESQPTTTTTVTPLDSQTSADTTITTPDETSTDKDAPPQPALLTPPQIPHLLRLRTSLTYLTTTYVPPTLRSSLSTLLTTTSTIDFTPLTTHLSALAALKAEAAALRSISDNISRKRALAEDEEKVAEREEKKRKKEEEEKKKKREGRAVAELKKVDTSGMKKMSSFFMKVPKKT
ncbi:hypothetical protein IQ07DRAFT_568899 [Pyrenochaeta sp. DS3sAY3a]|nr:hypothetical protein IQ07DRAFT_568899 [Pyrenochaeta sp. DS3sAY3a]